MHISISQLEHKLAVPEPHHKNCHANHPICDNYRFQARKGLTATTSEANIEHQGNQRKKETQIYSKPEIGDRHRFLFPWYSVKMNY